MTLVLEVVGERASAEEGREGRSEAAMHAYACVCVCVVLDRYGERLVSRARLRLRARLFRLCDYVHSWLFVIVNTRSPVPCIARFVGGTPRQ